MNSLTLSLDSTQADTIPPVQGLVEDFVQASTLANEIYS